VCERNLPSIHLSIHTCEIRNLSAAAAAVAEVEAAELVAAEAEAASLTDQLHSFFYTAATFTLELLNYQVITQAAFKSGKNRTKE